MEQATNQFTKGMQLDTHPMVQSNDTLTDCLNGTLITMNGNEVILQNDMGNRRVDKAFLPPGYEPVGMKEYGGIIYVAAYNPITNKSQIGSFPSPQKKLSSQDTNNGRFDFNTFTKIENGSNVEEDSVLGINVIKSDSFMIPLTNNLNLRAGDKFAVYSEGLSNLENLLTNYNNIYNGKAYSPKNRKYTLQLGVLNSQNEFVDITKTLCRWKDFGENNNHDWQPVKYDTEVSEIYKFNDGYFISDAFENTFNSETIDDAELIKERQKIAANTYAYKLVGPLYLKLSLNHIENFNYNIYGTYNNNIATLWFEGYLTYNCPDGAQEHGYNSNESYATFDEGQVSSDFGFDVRSGDSIISPTTTDVGISVYNPSTNTYTVKIVKKYTNITGVDGIFDYVIGVKADIDTDELYLKGLSTKGSINLSLLGSGEVSFNGWKFYNNYTVRNTLLTFAFNAYPEYGKSFTNLKFYFTKFGQQDIEYQYPKQGYLPLYNGKQTISFSWDELGLSPRTIYQVTASYSIVDNDTGAYLQNNVNVIDPITRWLLTTELFNEFYPSSAGVSDFCNVDQGNTDFYNKMKVKPKVETTIINRSNSTEEPVGELVNIGSEAISYLYKHYQRIDIEVKPKFVIEDTSIYPDFVEINSSNADKIDINQVFVSRIGENTNPQADSNTSNIFNYTSVLKSQLTPTIGAGITTQGIHNPTDALNDQKLIETTATKDGKTISGYIKYYDAYKGKGAQIQNINNAFDNFSEILKSENGVLPTTKQYGGIIVNFNSRGGGHADDHFLDVAMDQINDNVYLPSNDSRPEGWERIKSDDKRGRLTFNINEYIDKIFEVFNSKTVNKDITFLYIFSNDNYYPSTEQATSGIGGNTNTRLWWKMENGDWAVFPDLLTKSNGTVNVADFIKRELGNKELVYCMYQNYIYNNNIYVAKSDYKYYNAYNIPLDYTITYNITPGYNASHIVNTDSSCGNLVFTAELPELNSDVITFDLKSSQKFFNAIDNLDSDSISNVYIKNGTSVDSEGRALNPSFVYYLSDGKLVRIDDNRFYIDKTRVVDGKNRLLYNKTKKDSVIPRFQSTSSEESHTVLIYNSVNVVQAI